MKVRAINTQSIVLTSSVEGDAWAEVAFKAIDSTGKGYLTRKEILEMI